MDDDIPPSIQFELSSLTVAESGGSAILRLSVDGLGSSEVSVDVSTADGTARAGEDYTATAATFTFSPEDEVLTRTVTVPILNDDTLETAETFTVTLSNPTDGAVIGDNGVVTVTITDSDMVSVGFSEDTLNVEALEGSRSAEVTVVVEGMADAPVSVEVFTVADTATARADFRPVTQRITFQPDEPPARTVTLRIFDDRILESSERFTVELRDPGEGVVIGENQTAQVTILDNDRVTFRIAPTAVEVAESAGEVELTVSINGVSDSSVGVDFSTRNGSAMADSDFVATSGTLTFEPSGPTSQSIRVQLLDDEVIEDDEQFLVELSNATGGARLGSNSTSTVTILAEDFVEVPDVPGLDAEQAVSMLEGEGLEATLQNEESASVPAGIVIRTDPAPDTRVAAGTVVTVIVSSGDEGAAAPQARAKDKVFTVPEGKKRAQVTLDGSRSRPGSEPGSTIVLYEWTNRETEELVDSSDSPTTKFKLPPGEYEFNLRVVNNFGLDDSTNMQVTVEETGDFLPDEDDPTVTENQRETAEAVVDVCQDLSSTPDEELTANQRDLQAQCTAIIQTDSSSAQLAALDAINGQQVTGFATNSAEIATIQTKNVAARIDALKKGTRGISVAGLGLSIQGKRIPDSVVQGVLDKLTGGVAGDNEGPLDRLGIFINGNITIGEQDETDRQTGFDFTTGGITVGADYRFTDSFVAGLAVGYGEGDIDFDNNTGGVDTDGWSGVVFGSYFEEKFYVDAQYSRGWVNHDSTRKIRYGTGSAGDVETIDRVANGNTDGTQWSTGIEAGLNYDQGGWSIVPNMSLYYSKADIDRFQEGGAQGLNLVYDSQEAESLTLSVGTMVAYAWTPSWGVLRPHARLDYVAEFEDDSSIVNVRFQSDPTNTNPIAIRTDEPDGGYLLLGLGLSAQFPYGFSGFVDWQTLERYENFEMDSFSFGVRFDRSF